jgi:uncharacterized protein (TIGR02466 family)
MNKPRVTPLFGIPLYTSAIQPLDPITFNKLLNLEWEVPSYEDQEFTHQESAERHLLDRPSLAGLKKQLQSKIDEYVHDIIGIDRTLSWEITTSWVNKAKKGESHPTHWHSNSMISGVLYLKLDDKSGNICFHKAQTWYNIFGNTFKFDTDKLTDYNAETLVFSPNVYDVFLFPSTLAHSVMPSESNSDRFSLAFNVFPKGTIGKGGNSELTL